MQLCTWQRIPPKPSVRNLGKCFTIPERARIILARQGGAARACPVEGHWRCRWLLSQNTLSFSAVMKESWWISSPGAEKPGCRFASNAPWHEPGWKYTCGPRLTQDIFLGRARNPRPTAAFNKLSAHYEWQWIEEKHSAKMSRWRMLELRR